LAGVQVQRLLHGFEAAAWVFIELAAKRGYDTRIGLEDTLVLPGGTRARGTTRNCGRGVAHCRSVEALTHLLPALAFDLS
jgi:uncharacterized protein (DUF849 family)